MEVVSLRTLVKQGRRQVRVVRGGSYCCGRTTVEKGVFKSVNAEVLNYNPDSTNLPDVGYDEQASR